MGGATAARRSSGRRILSVAAAIASIVVALPLALVWLIAGYNPLYAVRSIFTEQRELPVGEQLPELQGAAIVDADTSKLPLIDVLRTRSGHWRLYDGGRDTTLARYVWTLDENPKFVRVMVCKRAFTHENHDGDQLELTPVAAMVRHKGESYGWQLTVAQGACRLAQNVDPVPPHADWLRQAIDKGRLPAYRRERSFLPTPIAGLKTGLTGGYDPSSLGGSSSADNYVGVTSAQGGEYRSSRGFIHDADARIVDAVLHDEALMSAWEGFTAYSWYSLAQPQGAVWSPINHVTVDPQFPQANDRPWEFAVAGKRERPDIDSVTPAEDWRRDVSHLENTGFVHWIMTEDPVAGLVVQRQTAFALASWYEWRRKRGDTRYHAYDEQERGAFNLLSTVWKARDVSMRVASRRGSVIWRPLRAEKMAADVIADLDARRVRPMLAATPASGDDYVRRIVGLPMTGLSTSVWKTADGGTLKLRGSSAFQLAQYGKEPLYLWTRAGNPTVRRWFAIAARHLVTRTLHVGGARGIDGVNDARGSTYPMAPEGTLPYADDLGWAAWVRSLPMAAPIDRLDGAGLHTLTQIQGTLLLAQAAGIDVPELDSALATIDADWARTTAPRYADLDMAKHWAAPR